MYSRFADVYGSNAYGENTYACNTQTHTGTNCSTAGGSSGTGTNPLANTGVLVALIVGVACLLLLIVVLVRFWRRPAKSAARVQANAPSGAAKPE
ncbi:MAG TPA: hypothetical protein VLF62_01110 [Candidatus Saccharimonadales bacterium]|nr:hypothetical protein [Candidatus Saccharimonadales bacterium]